MLKSNCKEAKEDKRAVLRGRAMDGLIGKKLGMTQLFDEKGKVTPVTVLQVGPCFVVQRKSSDKEGYNAVQLGFGKKKIKNVTKPLQGHFEKSDFKEGFEALREIKIDPGEDHKIGESLSVDIFEVGEYVDVTGKSKGKGFAGVIKRHHFHGSPAAHGTHEYFRHGGSIGSSAYPAKVFKGMKMPGQYGNERVTIQNLVIVEIKKDRNLMMVKGAVPGPNGGIVMVKRAVKKSKETKRIK